MLLGFSKESLGKNNVKLKTKISIMRKKTMFLGLLGAGLMWMPASAILAAQMTNAAMSVQQNQGIKGTVVDATGETLIGASVKVAGTTNGAVTDIDGNFTLNCKPGATLEVSYIGYKTMTVKAANGMKITMQEDGKALNEVVVTALGIKRDRKALGYGLEEVKGEELTKAKETNVINSLSGKVAGLVVQNTAGGASGSTRVLLRGNTEMAGNNQPLYVVDGVPLDNTNFGSAGEAGGYDLGDGISAINPDDIETMTVLKGPAASALYGSRASHGVILITTKKAEKDKIAVEYNGSFTIDTQLAKWNDIQEVYGMGYGGKLPTSSTSGTNSSWGPKADDFVYKYFDGQEHAFMMYPNNASDFFRTGLTAQNSAILSVNSGKTGMRISFTDMRNKDILPNTNMSRDNFNLRVNTSAGPVDFDFTANYTREDVKNRPALGDSQSNVGKNLMTLAGTYNQAWLKNYEDADGNYQNWNGNDQYNKNPYWDLYKNSNTSKKDVFRLTGKAIWNIDKHLKLQGTIGTDITNMNFEDFIAKTTPGTPAGKLTDQIFNNRTLNAELLALYNNSWGDFDVNEDLRKYIRMTFGDSYQVVDVESAEAALKYLKEGGVCDIVVSDVMMPGMHGDEFCRSIKENKETSWLPVILLTAKAGRDFMIEGLGLGADDYIAKPFDTAILASKVASILKNRRRLSQYYMDRSLALVRGEVASESASSEQIVGSDSSYEHLEPTGVSEEKKDDTVLNKQGQTFENVAEAVLDSQDQAFVDKAIRLVLSHLSDTDFNIDRLCREMAMSRTLFYGRLKTLTGQSPQDFMRLIRLEQAAIFLKQGDSVLDVSVKAGFVNVKYFSTVFKKHFGVSPSKYL
jgi:TonB-dependent SusC/RagA subfamily outer membrane receptor